MDKLLKCVLDTFILPELNKSDKLNGTKSGLSRSAILVVKLIPDRSSKKFIVLSGITSASIGSKKLQDKDLRVVGNLTFSKVRSLGYSEEEVSKMHTRKYAKNISTIGDGKYGGGLISTYKKGADYKNLNLSE